MRQHKNKPFEHIRNQPSSKYAWNQNLNQICFYLILVMSSILSQRRLALVPGQEAHLILERYYSSYLSAIERTYFLNGLDSLLTESHMVYNLVAAGRSRHQTNSVKTDPAHGIAQVMAKYQGRVQLTKENAIPTPRIISEDTRRYRRTLRICVQSTSTGASN